MTVSASARLNAVFAFFVTVVFTVLGLTAVTGPIMLSQAETSSALNVASVSVKTGRIGYYYDYTKPLSELGTITFDLEADLSQLFNWNTKQLFVYVVAEYSTDTHRTNQVVIWDDIVLRKDDAMLSLQNQKPEYLAADINHKIRGLEANLSLHWNIVPWVGILQWDRSGSAPLKF